MSTLDQELNNRITLLEKMKVEGITNYRDVTDIVRSYYLDRETILRAEKLSNVVAVQPTQKIAWGGKGGEKM